MTIYEITSDRFRRIDETNFCNAGLRERQDLQRLLRSQIEIVAPDTLVISEEFGAWEGSSRRIDLLGIDKNAKLVVIELKRTEDGGHMELQSIRYAAMVSAMTFERAVEVYAEHLERNKIFLDARSTVLDFLGWEEPDEDQFAKDVRIVLVSAEFSKELTTTVLWLNECGLDIKCVRVKPYNDNGRILVDVQQIIPLPEAEDYRVRLREKQQLERVSRVTSRDTSRYDVTINGQIHEQLSKRVAIYTIVRHLADSGHSPESMIAAVPWKTTMFRSADGELSEEQFAFKLQSEAAEGCKAFDGSRSFCSNGELMISNGKTYAFTNQWGPQTTKAMDQLIAAFAPNSVSYRLSE